MFRQAKARFFWPVLLVVLLTDCATKELAEEHLLPAPESSEILGDVVRFTLTHNTGGAMGMSIGEYSRVLFSVAALIGVVVLGVLYWRLPVHAKLRSVGFGLLLGGAVGNLADRIRSARGVVDFIDIGYGSIRFWTFNVGDIGITCGALLLLICILYEDRRAVSEIRF